MKKRVNFIKESPNNPLNQNEDYTPQSIYDDVSYFLEKNNLKHGNLLKESPLNKARVIYNHLKSKKDDLTTKTDVLYGFDRYKFNRIYKLLNPKDDTDSFGKTILEFAEVFWDIITPPSTISNDNIQNEDHTTPINPNDFQNWIVDQYKSDGIPSKAIELEFEIQESIFNYYTHTKSKTESTLSYRTNSASSNKVSEEILNFKQLTFITGLYNSNISQLAKWLCKQACLQSNHSFPIPVYIDISGKSFQNHRYCLEEQVVAQYEKVDNSTLSIKICEVLTKSDQFKLIIDGVDTLSDEDQKYHLPRQLKRINQTDCIIITRKGSRMCKQYPWVNQISICEEETKASFKNLSDPKSYIEELEFTYSQDSKSYNTSSNKEQVDHRLKEFKGIILQAEKFACKLLQRRNHKFKNESKNIALKSLAEQLHQLDLGKLFEIEASNSWRFHFLSPDLEEYLISCHIEKEFNLDSIITLAFETQTLTLALQLLKRKAQDSECITKALQQLKERYENSKDIKYHYLFFIFMTNATYQGNNNLKDCWTEEFGQDFVSTYLSSLERKKWHYFLSESVLEIFKQLNDQAKVEFIELIIANLRSKYQEYLHENRLDNNLLTEINCLIHLLNKVMPDAKINVFDSYKELIFDILHQLKETDLRMNVQSSVFDSIFHNFLKFFNGADFNTILELTYRLKRELLSNVPKDISSKEIVHNQQIQNLIKHLNSPDFLIQCATSTLENEIDCWFTIYDPIPNEEDTALLEKHLNNLTNIFFKIASDKYLDETEKARIIPIIIKGVYTIIELPKPYKNEEVIKKIYKAYQLLDIISIDASIAFWDSIYQLDVEKFNKKEIKDLLDKLQKKSTFDNALLHIACKHETPYQFLGPYLEKLAARIVKFETKSVQSIRLKEQLRKIVKNDKTGWASIECLRKPPFNSEKEYLNNVMNVVLEESNFHSTNVWSIVEKYAGSKDTYDIFISILSKKIRYEDSRNILPIIQLWTNYPQLSTLQYEKLNLPIYLLLKGIQVHREKLDNEFNWDEVRQSFTEIIDKVQTTPDNKRDAHALLRDLLLYSLSKFNKSCMPSSIDLNQYSEYDQKLIKEEILEIYKPHELEKMRSIFEEDLLEDLVKKSIYRNMDQWEMLNEKMEDIVFNNEMIEV